VPHLKLSRRAGQAAAVATVGLAMLTFGTTAAFADTSNATANAATITLLGATTGTETAVNDNSATADVETASPPISILGTQSAITAGVLQQTAVAAPNGASSACAGLLGNGAIIQVGVTNICDLTTNAGETGGVTLGGPEGMGVLTATAIVETCTDNATGTPTATATLVHATALGGAVDLPVNPGKNTSILGLILLNTQSVKDGKITATALSVPAIGLTIGTVTCGPDATTSVTSVFPVKSLPIAGGTALVLGAGGVLWYRRRQPTTSAS
jgi:hypothetical protein